MFDRESRERDYALRMNLLARRKERELVGEAKRKKAEARRAIEDRREALELGIDIKDLLG